MGGVPSDPMLRFNYFSSPKAMARPYHSLIAKRVNGDVNDDSYLKYYYQGKPIKWKSYHGQYMVRKAAYLVIHGAITMQQYEMERSWPGPTYDDVRKQWWYDEAKYIALNHRDILAAVIEGINYEHDAFCVRNLARYVACQHQYWYLSDGWPDEDSFLKGCASSETTTKKLVEL